MSMTAPGLFWLKILVASSVCAGTAFGRTNKPAIKITPIPFLDFILDLLYEESTEIKLALTLLTPSCAVNKRVFPKLRIGFFLLKR
jgi:hypothetical protein